MMKTLLQKPSSDSRKVISSQLELMLGSPDFNATPQQRALLEYVVNQTLAGNDDQIKGYTVATEVFGRREDFDQSIDPIVSIQASRLRQALARYYDTAGKIDRFRIDIPLGTYVPKFSEQFSDDQHIAAEQAEPVCDMATWPTVLVRPLTILTGNSADDYLAIGLAAELAHALSHYREVRVLEAIHRDQKSPPPEMNVKFIIGGNVRRDPEGVKVSIRLRDAHTGQQIWAGKYQGDFATVSMISFQEDVAAEVAVRLAGGNAVIPRHLSGLSKDKPVSDLTTYEAMLRYWEYDARRTRQSYTRAIRALEHAVTHDPDCGQTLSMLANLYADNYGLEIINPPTSLEKAADFARKAVGLDPINRRIRMILAYIRFMEDKLREARREAEEAYKMHSCSLMYLDVIGWLMSLAGEWERGLEYVNKAVQINPYYRPWVRHALCLNRFRLGQYEKAYRETQNLMMPESHWDQILKASACGHLGKIEEGQAHVRALLALKPDFEKRGRMLIRHYIKFEDIVERVIKGLYASGIEVK
jgi:TolB-like protein/Tfp pilus assembly protein PilF